ncbi:MAG: aspartate aminotransferase family protein [Bacteroidales bacterium]|jgi:acetylornithine/succinyldiaminopimelate/putrescine aminotransferase|nr:aspartate aminotransferase family protein [Bacteroidales bacterium]
MFQEHSLFYELLAQTSPSPLGIQVSHAEGVFLYGPDGKKYFDLVSGVSVSNAGHKNPEVEKALAEQIQKYTHLMVYGELIQSPQVQYAEFLTSLLPPQLNNVYFVNSGAEAVEGAMKLAKKFTGRTEIIACKNAYHGSTQGALSIMGNEKLKQPFRPLLPDIRFIDFNNENDIPHITEKTVCVIVEPIQGEAGIILPQNDYLGKLRKKCDETGALLVFDEVQTGILRTGKNFAFEHYGAVPDILVLAKALGGGMPLGAFVTSKNIMQSLTHNPSLGHITTFGGHPVCCAAGLASFRYLKNNITDLEIDSKANLFYSLLEDNKFVKEIRYKGLLMAVELADCNKIQQFIRLGVEHGIISDWFLFCDTAFRISPPLTITEDEIQDVVKIINLCLKEL